MELDGVPLWRGDHVAVRQLVEDFAQYLYRPRISEARVLLTAIAVPMQLEDLQANAAVRGILANESVTVVSVQWFGAEALELT